METGPIEGDTASTCTPGEATARAASPMSVVIDHVVLGLMTRISTAQPTTTSSPSRSATSRSTPARVASR